MEQVMITSIGLMLILGLVANAIFTKLNLPGLLGMLLVGVVTGPYVLDWLSPELLVISGGLRQFALIVILLRAGLGISKEELKRVGFSAVKFSFLPGLIEGFTIAFAATWLFGFTFIEGGILGFIIAAVSPAVVVPRMLELSEQKTGTDKGIPTLILAGASIDDVFAITIFSTFLGLYGGSRVNIGLQLLGIPLSIILGVVLGMAGGLVLAKLFTRFHLRDTKKVIYILGAAILLTAIEGWLKDWEAVASLLGVMAMGFMLMEKVPAAARRLAVKFNKIWILAEILLFVLVGAQVNIHVALQACQAGLLIVTLGLGGRTIGVLLATAGSDLNWKERLFCAIAYLPKATVQAAIGAIPLSMGVSSGEVILAVAVLSILFTAPLGAVGIQQSAGVLLKTESTVVV
jgi:solute carrier family 9B (sodium/hydrogen exchanger), member 1/2